MEPIKDSLSPSWKNLESSCKESALYSWSKGNDFCPQPPSIIYLCPTNVCNHNCCTCGYFRMRKGKNPDGTPQRGYMDLNLFKKIVADLPRGHRRVYLQKTGESLLHPNITEMMGILHHERPEYERAIHTNCTVLRPSTFSALLEHMNFISLSIFGFDEESYHKAHGADHYNKVMDNIGCFHKAWLASSQRPKVYFDVVRNIHNQHLSNESIFDFLQKRFPAFSTGVHFPFNFQGIVADYHNEIFENLDKKYFPRCIHPWDMFTILWDGKVGHCVGDPQEKTFLGDLNTQTVMEVWNGEEYRDYRKKIVLGKWQELHECHIHCGTCNWNFALKSQNMNNLCLAYRGSSSQENAGQDDVVFNGDEFLQKGFYYYLRGDLADAMKSFLLAATISRDEKIQAVAHSWRKNVEDVFAMRKDIEYWEEALEREGHSLRTFHMSNYRISKAMELATEGLHHHSSDGSVTKKGDF